MGDVLGKTTGSALDIDSVEKMKGLITQSCLTLGDPMDRSPPGSPVHGIVQARILEWAAIPVSRESSLPRDRSWVSYIVGRYFTV